MIAVALVACFVGFDGYREPGAVVDDAGDVDAPSPEFGPIEPIAIGQDRVQSVAVDREHVFWLVAEPSPEQDLGFVFAQLKTPNAAPTKLAVAPRPRDLVLDGGDLFWIGCDAPGTPVCRGSIFRVRVDGGGLAHAVWASYELTAVAADPITVYALDDFGRLVEGAKSSIPCAATCGATELSSKIRGTRLALGPDAIYVSFPSEQAIAQFDRRDFAAGDRLFAGGQAAAVALSADAAALYWVNDPAGTVMKLDFDKAGQEPMVLARGERTPAALAVDSAYVWFTTLGDGAVKIVPKGGGAVRTLASGLAAPVAIAVDDTGAFVATRDDGRIQRIPRRSP
jgi:hypothetical protein